MVHVIRGENDGDDDEGVGGPARALVQRGHHGDIYQHNFIR